MSETNHQSQDDAPRSEFTRQTILDALPHRPPFLFVDEILRWTETDIVTTYTFKPDEFFFAGHYPNAPIVPGVLLCESAMQAGAIFLSRLFAAEDAKRTDTPKRPLIPVVGRMNEIKFKRMVQPGETIRCEVKLGEKMGRAYFLSAQVTVGEFSAVRFEFACTRTASLSEG